MTPLSSIPDLICINCRFQLPKRQELQLKEDLAQLWKQPNKGIANCFLAGWIERALSANIPLITTFARTLSRYRRGILAYYDYHITTGPLEGINNKIKTLKRQVYGYRDIDFFKLKILALHEAKYALVG
ncbi:MAG TPA: hypothetical protein ENH11_10065 [Candidatus Acetothermia bacterium]|nr:hypothetical protein [Candidatus Acetothermia bacterium]